MCKKIVMLFWLCCPAFLHAESFDLQIPPQEILKLVQAGTTNFELPEVEVFNKEGKSIFYQKSLPKNFRADLEKAVQENRGADKSLQSHLENVVDANGNKFGLIGRTFDLAIVEYWADWCVSCKEQQKIVQSYISDNQNLKILWLKIEKDPTKIDGVVINKR